jgi:GGDEF domain-containing protein
LIERSKNLAATAISFTLCATFSSASIGLAAFSAASEAELMKQADLALYRAKREGVVASASVIRLKIAKRLRKMPRFIFCTIQQENYRAAMSEGL